MPRMILLILLVLPKSIVVLLSSAFSLCEHFNRRIKCVRCMCVCVRAFAYNRGCRFKVSMEFICCHGLKHFSALRSVLVVVVVAIVFVVIPPIFRLLFCTSFFPSRALLALTPFLMQKKFNAFPVMLFPRQ